MKKTNRFLSLIIIVFSFFAFTPSSHIPDNLDNDQVTIYEDAKMKLHLNNEISSIVNNAKMISSSMNFTFTSSKEISQFNILDTHNQSLSNYRLEDKTAIIDLTTLNQGTYTLNFEFCDDSKLASATFSIK